MRALILFAIFYIAFGIFLSLNQERIVYQPGPQVFADCEAFKGAEKITHRGTRMYVQASTSAPTVVLYHGNAGSACDRAFLAEQFTAAGYGYVVVEYGGYSNDPVLPTHERTKDDVQNVIHFLQQRGFSDVAVVGESIGAGVASYHAALAAPKKLLLVAPFPDLQAIAATRFWFYPTRALVDNAFRPIEHLRDYRGFVMIVHGREDTIIPYRLGEELYLSLSTEKHFVTIEQAGHNDLFFYEDTFTALQAFLRHSTHELPSKKI